MERRLLEAAQKGNIDELNDLIRSNALVLKEMALEGAGHTLLHVACVAGHVDVVRELLKLMPKFVEKVNAVGFSPLHIAAAQGDVEVVRELLRVEYEVVEVNASNESGSTPLDVSTLSPRGAGDREMREILARAGAKHGRGRSNLPASRPVSAADDDDIEGANSQQSDGEPVAPRSLSHLQSKDLNKDRESFGDIRNALLVVAALIASATYQSVLQPPRITTVHTAKGSDKAKAYTSNNITEVTTSTEYVIGTDWADWLYTFFLGGNTLGFLVSVQMIICLTQDLPVKRPLMLSLIAMVLTYFCFMLSLLVTSVDSCSSLMLLQFG
ncbi:hypothetical protein NL676_009403 [Syzygium grande]|nr:hypothetical protein NL676_009403 [Syzygium grande]